MDEYRIYKIPDGKGENAFAFSGEAKNKKYATEIIHECHEAWRRLAVGESAAKTSSYDLSMCVHLNLVTTQVWTHSKLPSRNLTIPGPGLTESHDSSYTTIPPDSRQPPAPIDPSSRFDPCLWSANSNIIPVSKWFYISSVQV